jgi:hypothetical protein
VTMNQAELFTPKLRSTGNAMYDASAWLPADTSRVPTYPSLTSIVAARAMEK